MADGKLSNLIQIANKKIEILNSHLEEQDENTFYSLPMQNPQEDHISRMIHDLDYLIARSDLDISTIQAPYLEVRSKLSDIKAHLANQKQNNQKDNKNN